MAATSVYQLFVFQLLLNVLMLGFPPVRSNCLKKTVYHAADLKARSVLFEGKEGSDVHCLLCLYPRAGFTKNYFLEVTWSMFKVYDDMPDCEKSYIEVSLTRSIKSIGKYCSKDTSFKMFNIYSHDGFARITYHNKKSSPQFAFKLTFRMRHYQNNYLLYTHTYNKNNTDLLSSSRWPKGPYPSTAYAEVYEIRINKGKETRLIFMDVDLADKSCNVGSNSLQITGTNKLSDEKEIIKDCLCRETGYVVTTEFTYIYIQFNKPGITTLRNRRGFLAAYVTYYKPYKGATGSVAGDIGLGAGLVCLFILIIIIMISFKRKLRRMNRIHVKEYSDKEEANPKPKEEEEETDIELQNIEENGSNEQALMEAEILARKEEEENQKRELEEEILKKMLAAQLLKEVEEKHRAFEQETRLLSEETDAVVREKDLQRLADLAEKIAIAVEQRGCDTGIDAARKEEDLKQLTDLTERVVSATKMLRLALEEERTLKEEEMRRRRGEEAQIIARENEAKRHAEKAERAAVEAERKRRAKEEAEKAAVEAEKKRLAAEAEKSAKETEKREKTAERKRRAKEEAEKAAIEAERKRLAAEAENIAREEERKAKEAERKRLAEEAKKKAIAEARARKVMNIKMQLAKALQSGESQTIRTAIGQAKDAQLSELQQDIENATEILERIEAGENLRDAMARRHLADLETSVDFIRRKKFETEYAAALIEADVLIKRLRKLEHLRREILELNQSTISEIRSYRDPPPSVHEVMIAVYLLLGHNEDSLKVWNNMRVLVGKMGQESLKKLVTSLDATQIDSKTAVYAEQTYLSKHDLESIRIISEGAAVFYIWCKSMIEESNAWREESKKRKQSGKRKLK
eukprot:Seg741.2 transcript_id=Seg741.2/GoldUCD/mRNA.D3Y31 product="hypothetical protein" protein_id=Seg741.2/GoldUCD/D3Y31